jgi:hypothetical protein
MLRAVLFCESGISFALAAAVIGPSGRRDDLPTWQPKGKLAQRTEEAGRLYGVAAGAATEAEGAGEGEVELVRGSRSAV